jgi:hypothetical protein
MGQSIYANCNLCGFSNNFNFGGSKTNYLKYCPVPAINLTTSLFENVNYFEYDKNINYLFYSDKILKTRDLNCTTLNNFDLKLNTEQNYCPNCKKYSLSFKVTHFYD